MKRYEIIESIGEGTYGIVLKCKDSLSGQYVAIKKYKHLNGNEYVRRTMARELQAQQVLRGEPFVVNLIEAFREKGTLYLVMDYVKDNLLDILDRHPRGLRREDVRCLLFTLLVGVRSCHRCGIIHRDIKPENILVCLKKGTATLCDFGFSRPKLHFDRRYEPNFLVPPALGPSDGRSPTSPFSMTESSRNTLRGSSNGPTTRNDSKKICSNKKDENNNLPHALTMSVMAKRDEELEEEGSSLLSRTPATPTYFSNTTINPRNKFFFSSHVSYSPSTSSKLSLEDASLEGSQGVMTDYVATRWYRSPEMLVGFPHYSFPVDMWAVGCIMAEACDGQPLFPGHTELEQIQLIQQRVGPFPRRYQTAMKERMWRGPRRRPSPECNDEQKNKINDKISNDFKETDIKVEEFSCQSNHESEIPEEHKKSPLQKGERMEVRCFSSAKEKFFSSIDSSFQSSEKKELNQEEGIAESKPPPQSDTVSFSRGKDSIKMKSSAVSTLSSSPATTEKVDYLSSRYLPIIGADGLHLLRRLLTIEGNERITVDDALSHPFFKDLSTRFDPYARVMETPVTPIDAEGTVKELPYSVDPTARYAATTTCEAATDGRRESSSPVFSFPSAASPCKAPSDKIIIPWVSKQTSENSANNEPQRIGLGSFDSEKESLHRSPSGSSAPWPSVRSTGKQECHSSSVPAFCDEGEPRLVENEAASEQRKVENQHSSGPLLPNRIIPHSTCEAVSAEDAVTPTSYSAKTRTSLVYSSAPAPSEYTPSYDANCIAANENEPKNMECSDNCLVDEMEQSVDKTSEEGCIVHSVPKRKRKVNESNGHVTVRKSSTTECSKKKVAAPTGNNCYWNKKQISERPHGKHRKSKALPRSRTSFSREEISDRVFTHVRAKGQMTDGGKKSPGSRRGEVSSPRRTSSQHSFRPDHYAKLGALGRGKSREEQIVSPAVKRVNTPIMHTKKSCATTDGGTSLFPLVSNFPISPFDRKGNRSHRNAQSSSKGVVASSGHQGMGVENAVTPEGLDSVSEKVPSLLAVSPSSFGGSSRRPVNSVAKGGTPEMYEDGIVLHEVPSIVVDEVEPFEPCATSPSSSSSHLAQSFSLTTSPEDPEWIKLCPPGPTMLPIRVMDNSVAIIDEEDRGQPELREMKFLNSSSSSVSRVNQTLSPLIFPSVFNLHEGSECTNSHTSSHALMSKNPNCSWSMRSGLPPPAAQCTQKAGQLSPPVQLSSPGQIPKGEESHSRHQSTKPTLIFRTTPSRSSVLPGLTSNHSVSSYNNEAILPLSEFYPPLNHPGTLQPQQNVALPLGSGTPSLLSPVSTGSSSFIGLVAASAGGGRGTAMNKTCTPSRPTPPLCRSMAKSPLRHIPSTTSMTLLGNGAHVPHEIPLPHRPPLGMNSSGSGKSDHRHAFHYSHESLTTPRAPENSCLSSPSGTPPTCAPLFPSTLASLSSHCVDTGRPLSKLGVRIASKPITNATINSKCRISKSSMKQSEAEGKQIEEEAQENHKKDDEKVTKSMSANGKVLVPHFSSVSQEGLSRRLTSSSIEVEVRGGIEGEDFLNSFVHPMTTGNANGNKDEEKLTLLSDPSHRDREELNEEEGDKGTKEGLDDSSLAYCFSLSSSFKPLDSNGSAGLKKDPCEALQTALQKQHTQSLSEVNVGKGGQLNMMNNAPVMNQASSSWCNQSNSRFSISKFSASSTQLQAPVNAKKKRLVMRD